MDFKLGNPHVSKDSKRGYVEYDPHVTLPDGRTLHGEHGLTDICAEIALTAYDAKMLDNPLIRDILKK